MHQPPSRQDFADELRGVALLGIVLVNAPFLGISVQGYTDASVLAPGDRVAAVLTVALAQAKFYLLFAFLFGYSTSFLVRGDDRGSRRRFGRRLLGLCLLGALHAVGLFVGDILLLYGLLGWALLMLHRWREVALVRLALGVGSLWVMLLGALAMTPADAAPGGSWRESVAAFDAAMASGSWGEAVQARLAFWPLAASVIGLLNGMPVLALFALGLLAGRRRLLAQPDSRDRLWRRGRWLGTLLGLPLASWGAWLAVGPDASLGAPGRPENAGLLLGFASAPLLSWSYVGWLVSWRERVPDGLRWFRAAGRMSLSGYLGESLLLSLVFCAYGLGLFGQVGAAGVACIAALVWVVLDGVAHITWRVAPRGPAEQLLRWFTGP